ncbi:GNAT superfamily N-acetyltransferase [Desulfomicrobium macestii]|uniref:GNAT superfamily N-acetyltransferase n=1 Tax=Desulfomicrobium macestii TaxID=90731 RepID=A0ABR9GZJ7_9BACT|nr:GNAT family N-acetyltransferase [Desulfomicrobium macestii]MBE1423875.1 GNAT superfamily N-acetyltransferase [Desulfomicrobium macestii]
MFEPVRKLQAGDDLDGFDCGQPALNQFLQRFALMNQKASCAQTYVSIAKGRVAGFYSLAVGSVSPADAPCRVAKGLARHPVPVMILARLAVDVEYQRNGLGRALLKNALLRTLQAADIAGIRAVLVHAKDAQAREWYASWDFEPSMTDPYHLFLLLKDLKSALDR